jgi:hypothetical protein
MIYTMKQRLPLSPITVMYEPVHIANESQNSMQQYMTHLGMNVIYRTEFSGWLEKASK